MFKKILVLIVVFLLASCSASRTKIVTKKSQSNKPKKTIVYTSKKANSGAKKSKNKSTEVIESTSKTVVTNDVVYGYITDFKDVAIRNMKKYGIPASIILAQGILESGAGKGDLALAGNNHFGIKCHKDWTGETINHDDDASQECFRKYSDPSESYKDHAVFLTTGTRYSSLFELPKGDYESWAKGLRRAGYATDPQYPEKLISYIERYGLHQFDEQVLGKSTETIGDVFGTKSPLEASNNSDLYEVQQSDTFYSISKKYNLTVEELKQINNLSEDTLSIGQKIRVK
jgi:flagellum-specific peptidoglycan hydrolase FlgJ